MFGSCDNLQHTSISTEHSDITGLTELLSYIRDSEIGKDEVIEGPFGRKRSKYLSRDERSSGIYCVHKLLSTDIYYSFL